MRIQMELKAPKWQFNKFGGYKYRSCEDIIEAVKPLLAKEWLVLLINDQIVQVGDRYYVKAEVRLEEATEDGWPIAFATAYAREEDSKKGMDWAQVTGAASSYARKYALCWLLAIDDWIDPDSTNKWEEPAKEESSAKDWFNDPELDKFCKVCRDYPGADEALKVIRSKYKVSKAMETKIRELYADLDELVSK